MGDDNDSGNEGKRIKKEPGMRKLKTIVERSKF